jgi:hypothetical protein
MKVLTRDVMSLTTNLGAFIEWDAKYSTMKVTLEWNGNMRLSTFAGLKPQSAALPFEWFILEPIYKFSSLLYSELWQPKNAFHSLPK